MRLILSSLLTLILSVSAVRAQSIADNIPGAAPVEPPPAAAPPAPSAPAADPYTVENVTGDATADTADRARDAALLQAEHAAYAQLCARLGAPESAAKIPDEALSALVRSFDMQSEKASAKHYAGVYTIHFKAAALQKRLGKYMAPQQAGDATSAGSPDMGPAPLPKDVSHLPVSVETPSLAVWAQIKRRLGAVPQIARADVIDLGRGTSHVDLVYTGPVDGLPQAVAMQGLSMQQDASGEWRINGQ